MGTLDQPNAWIELDIGKTDHVAGVLDDVGSSLFARAVHNDDVALETLLHRSELFGSPVLVVDHPGSKARLVFAVPARRGEPVCLGTL